MVWAIVLLSVLAAGLGSRSAFALGFAARLERTLQASYLAAAGVERAAQALDEDASPTFDGLNELWVNNEYVFARQPLGEGRYSIVAAPGGAGPQRYGLIDEERKLNVNTVSSDVVLRLLQRVAGMKPNDAMEAAESLVDWRDEDHEALPHGAEKFYYLGLSPSYDCKDAPLENIEELLLVRGVSVEVFDRIRPYVTVHGSGGVNVNTADAAVLDALGLSPQGVDGLLWYRAGEDSLEATSDDRALPSIGAVSSELGSVLPAEDLNRISRLAGDGQVGVSSSAFFVTVEATMLEESVPARVHAVIDREGRVLAWSER